MSTSMKSAYLQYATLTKIAAGDTIRCLYSPTVVNSPWLKHDVSRRRMMHVFPTLDSPTSDTLYVTSCSSTSGDVIHSPGGSGDAAGDACEVVGGSGDVAGGSGDVTGGSGDCAAGSSSYRSTHSLLSMKQFKSTANNTLYLKANR